jgi:hypothetical protein
MKPRPRLCCLLLAATTTASNAFAETPPAPFPVHAARAHVGAVAVRAGAIARGQQPTASRRDPLRNGAVIGAIVGAVATFTFGAYLCHAIREEGDRSCLPPALLLAGAGAGAGAAAGAGIDALFGQRPIVQISVHF